MLDGTSYNASMTSGYLLSASSDAVWDAVATHFADLVADV